MKWKLTVQVQSLMITMGNLANDDKGYCLHGTCNNSEMQIMQLFAQHKAFYVYECARVHISLEC